MGAQFLALGVSLPLLLVGVWLLKSGWWPSRSGATPYCRKCHYNLTGVDRERDGARCPECGAATSGKRGVVVGTRRRSWVKAWAGAILIPVGLTPHALVAYNAIPSWENWFPTAMLIDYLVDSRPQVVDVSAAELQERYQAGLAEENIRRLAATCLRIQSDPNLPGFSAALDLLGLLHTGDHLTEPERARYYEQIPELKLLVRERIPVDKPLIVQLSSQLYFSRQTDPDLTMRIRWQAPLLDGTATDGETRTHFGNSRGQSRRRLYAVEGSHQLTTEVRVDVFHPMIWFNDTTTPPSYSFTRNFAADLEVVAAETEVVRIIRDPAIAGAMEAGITLHRVSLRGAPQAGTELSFLLYARALPVGLAARAYIQGHPECIGQVVIPASKSAYMAGLSKDHMKGLPAPPWTIVLRPDLELAYEDPTIDAIWGEEIRIVPQSD